MNKYQSLPPSPPPQTAKANRDRLFSQPAPILEVEAKKADVVRQNMERLRELRLAKEAQEVRTEISSANNPAKTEPKKW
jgi:hypothetical protein